MLPLTDLLANYKGSITVHGKAEGLQITSIASDSRQVKNGSLFAAIRGNAMDGNAYIPEAVEKGAAAVLTDAESDIKPPKPVVVIKVDSARLALAKMAGVFYAPQPECIAAVTGTDGKTSTTDFLRQLWEMSDLKAASIGTLGILGAEGKPLFPSVNTTPDTALLHQTLQTLATSGYRHVSMEASSHGLDQHRLSGVHIKAAAFTNLTRDHLDYHKTEENYFLAKEKLFSELLPPTATAVLNADDPRFSRLKEVCEKRHIKVTSFGVHGSEYRIRKVNPAPEGIAVQAEVLGKSQHFMLNMIGEFQVMNALAALGLYIACGGAAQNGLTHLPHLRNVRGRLEKVAVHPDGAGIYIDYAHTPAALDNVLRTIRNHVKGRLTVVFGCGGDRDKGKRIEMGKVANTLADSVIITDDNPRSENPAAIREEILRGAPGAKNIGDRAEAINRAVRSLRSSDILLIAGKGHETTQVIGNKSLPFSDAETAREAVKSCKKKAS